MGRENRTVKEGRSKSVKERRSKRGERSVSEGRSGRVLEKTPEEKEAEKQLALALSASVGDALRSFPSLKIVNPTRKTGLAGKDEPLPSTTRIGKQKGKAKEGEQPEAGTGDLSPVPPQDDKTSSPRMTSRRTGTVHIKDPDRVKREVRVCEERKTRGWCEERKTGAATPF